MGRNETKDPIVKTAETATIDFKFGNFTIQIMAHPGVIPSFKRFLLERVEQEHKTMLPSQAQRYESQIGLEDVKPSMPLFCCLFVLDDFEVFIQSFH